MPDLLGLDHVFVFGSNTVANVNCVRDLGVLVDSNLSFAENTLATYM